MKKDTSRRNELYLQQHTHTNMFKNPSSEKESYILGGMVDYRSSMYKMDSYF